MRTILVLLFFLLPLINLNAQIIDHNSAVPIKTPGLYYIPQDGSQDLVRVDLSLVVGNQAGGGVHYGSGVGNKAYEKSIDGKTSKTQISQPQPVFYLYLEPDTLFSEELWIFSIANNPDDFLVIKLNQKADKREFMTGKDKRTLSWGSSEAGIEEKEIIQFDVSVITDNLYKITFRDPLSIGEYCFVYAGTVPSGSVNNKVLDFTICKVK